MPASFTRGFGNSAANVNTLAITISVAPAVNATLVTLCYRKNVATPAPVTPSTWTAWLSGTSSNDSAEGYHKLAAGTESSISFNWTGTGDASASYGEFNGVGATAPLEASSQNTTNLNVAATSIAPGSVTPISANGIAISLFGTRDTTDWGTLSIGSGYTINFQENGLGASKNRTAIASKTYTTTAAQNPTWSGTGIGDFCWSLIGAFKEPAANVAPTANPVTITGTAQVGHALTSNPTYNDADGDPAGTHIYRWLRDDVTISGATASTYQCVTADIGAVIKSGVTPVATSGVSPGAESISAGTAPVQGLPAPYGYTLTVNSGNGQLTDGGAETDYGGTVTSWHIVNGPLTSDPEMHSEVTAAATWTFTGADLGGGHGQEPGGYNQAFTNPHGAEVRYKVGNDYSPSSGPLWWQAVDTVAPSVASVTITGSQPSASVLRLSCDGIVDADSALDPDQGYEVYVQGIAQGYATPTDLLVLSDPWEFDYTWAGNFARVTLKGKDVANNVSAESASTAFALPKFLSAALTSVEPSAAFSYAILGSLYNSAMTWDEARATGSWDAVYDWLVDNTGPRVTLDPTPLTGLQTITNQAEADALAGKLIQGRIEVTSGSVTLVDFQVEATTGAEPCVKIVGNIADVTLRYFKLDGNGFKPNGVGGQHFADTIVCEYFEIVRCVDSVRMMDTNSAYRYFLVHQPGYWDEVLEGRPYDSGTDPHCDGFQAVRGVGATIEKGMIDMGDHNAYVGDPGIVSCIILKPDSDEISGVTMEQLYVNGGEYSIRIIDQPTSPTWSDWPLNTTLTDITYKSGYQTSHLETTGTPAGEITQTNVAAYVEPLVFTAPTKPAWLTLTDNGDGTAVLSGTSPADSGSHLVVIRATEAGNSLVRDQSFHVNVGIAEGAGPTTLRAVTLNPVTLNPVTLTPV